MSTNSVFIVIVKKKEKSFAVIFEKFTEMVCNKKICCDKLKEFIRYSSTFKNTFYVLYPSLYQLIYCR